MEINYEKWQQKNNCYSFSIHRAEDPAFYPYGNDFRYHPGNICGIENVNGYESIDDLAM